MKSILILFLLSISIFAENIYQKELERNQRYLELNLETYPLKYEAISENYESIGKIYYSMGEYDKAIDSLKKSLDIEERHVVLDSSSLADGYNNLGVLFLTIGNRYEALKYLKKALEIREQHPQQNQQLIYSAYSSMGSVYEELEEFNKSLHFYKKALVAYKKYSKKGDYSHDLASIYNAIGKLFLRIHSFKNAINYYKKSLKIRKKLSLVDTLDMANIYNNLGNVYMFQKEFNLSKEYLNKSIMIKEKILGADNNLLLEEYNNLGWLYFYQKKYNRAFEYTKKSIDIFLAKRDNYFVTLNDLENEHFIKNSEKRIALMFDISFYLGTKKSYLESLYYWFRYKGSIFDNQNYITTLYNKTDSKEVKLKIEKLLQLKRDLSKLYQHKVIDSSIKEKISNYEKDINLIRRELLLNKKNIKIDYQTIISALKPTELYIDFAKLNQQYYAFAIEHGGDIFFRRISIAHTKEIDRLVLAFRKDIKYSLGSKKIDSKVKLSRLYNLLLKTLVEKLAVSKKRLIVSTAGVLRLLPFESLYISTRNHYLIEERDIRYTPSGKAFLLGAENRDRAIKDEVVLFSNPTFDKRVDTLRGQDKSQIFNMKFKSLKGTKEEAELIKKILVNKKIVEFSGINANEKNFLKIKHPKILHIATHGFFIKSELKNPMLNAGIALSGANSSIEEGRGEGVITALKISGLDLKGTELVVLSACKTGLVSINSSDSVSLLSKAFLQAGANAIIASLWSVSDSGTKDLMRLFYSEVKKDNNYNRALKKAKIEMIKQNISPAIWGAFILNGE